MTQTQDILHFLDIIWHITNVKLQDILEDMTEAQLYEPWNFLLNQVVEKISEDLTAAPQCCLVRIHIAEDNSTHMLLWPFQAHVSLHIHRDLHL